MQVNCKLRLKQLQSEYFNLKLDMKFETNKEYMENLST